MWQWQEVQEVLPGPRASAAVATGPAVRRALDKPAQSAVPQIRSPSRRLHLTRHMAQVYQHPIDFNHPHERVLIQQAGQRPLGIKSARVQSLRDDARLRTGCALADPEPGT